MQQRQRLRPRQHNLRLQHGSLQPLRPLPVHRRRRSPQRRASTTHATRTRRSTVPTSRPTLVSPTQATAPDTIRAPLAESSYATANRAGSSTASICNARSWAARGVVPRAPPSQATPPTKCRQSSTPVHR